MRGSYNLIFILLLASSLAAGQKTTTPTATKKAAPKAAAESQPAEAPAASAASLPSEATVDSFFQQTFGYDTNMSWKISSIKPAAVPGLAEVLVVVTTPQGQQLSRLFVSSDGAHAVVGDVIPFGARPFDPAKKLLEKGITGPERGSKDAPVTIVEFGDLQCPACKAAQPAIEGLIAAEPNARFVFQNFPLEMHNWAAKGAAYADCVGRASNEAFWKFVAKTYETQTDVTAANADEKLTALADGAGVKGSEIAACAAQPDTKSRVDASVALGKSVEVTGTPTLFVNGRKIGNISAVSADTLKGLVDFAAKPGQGTAASTLKR
jgi:protein-disulfide isomerase